MSRGGSCKQMMNEPSAEVTSIKASGDCFYECVNLAFSMGGIDVRAFEGVNRAAGKKFAKSHFSELINSNYTRALTFQNSRQTTTDRSP
jgi:hypothetical protein